MDVFFQPLTETVDALLTLIPAKRIAAVKAVCCVTHTLCLNLT